MNLLTVAIGTLPCAYALYVLILRLKGKDKSFKKLGPMKEKFGEKPGSIIHYIAYVVLPIIIGLTIIFFGILGMSIMDWLNA